MTRMHNPPHPGETLRDDVLPALNLSVTQVATQLNVTRASLSRVLNGRAFQEDPTPIPAFCSASSVPLPLKGEGVSLQRAIKPP